MAISDREVDTPTHARASHVMKGAEECRESVNVDNCRLERRKEIIMRHGVVSRTVALVAGVVVSIAGVAAVPGAAWARALGAYAGNPLDNTDRSCFSEQQGGVKYVGTGTCPVTARWQVMLPVDASGTYTINLRGFRSLASSLFSCQALSQTQDGAPFGASPVRTPLATDQNVSLTMSVTVPNSGYLFLYCYGLGPFNSLFGITY
jgi:hypothetical protein